MMKTCDSSHNILFVSLCSCGGGCVGVYLLCAGHAVGPVGFYNNISLHGV